VWTNITKPGRVASARRYRGQQRIIGGEMRRHLRTGNAGRRSFAPHALERTATAHGRMPPPKVSTCPTRPDAKHDCGVRDAQKTLSGDAGAGKRWRDIRQFRTCCSGFSMTSERTKSQKSCSPARRHPARVDELAPRLFIEQHCDTHEIVGETAYEPCTDDGIDPSKTGRDRAPERVRTAASRYGARERAAIPNRLRCRDRIARWASSP